MPKDWNHNTHYHPLVLRAVPKTCGRALDIGCGEGLLASQLASHCREVIALDLHDLSLPSVASCSNVTFQQGDVITFPFAPASFDFITAIAVLHHLPLGAGLERMSELLRPNGTLVIIGLYRPATLFDNAQNAFALLISRMLRLTRGYGEDTAPLSPPRGSLAEVRQAAQAHLPGAKFKRRLLFRYSLIWRKPAAESTNNSLTR